MEDITSDGQLERLLLATGAKSVAELGRLLGITSQAIYNVKQSQQVPASWMPKVAKRFGVSTDWLFFGIGAMKINRVNPSESGQLDKNADADADELIRIPMVDAILSAGTGSLETSDQVAREYAFRRDFIQRKGNPANMVLMRVRGDSMQPEVMDNDVVLLDQSKTRPHPGPIFAVGIEDAIYLKRVDMLPGQIVLKSVNPDYKPIHVDMGEQTSDQFRVIGQVLWIGREYK
ncbi:MAG: Cro/Cl family transcriptional regulator [Desulfovibrio sp.]|nr:Cro/Cl family transcriptional regulator [Desulfovibrio sp.]